MPHKGLECVLHGLGYTRNRRKLGFALDGLEHHSQQQRRRRGNWYGILLLQTLSSSSSLVGSNTTGGPPRLLSESSHYKLNIADEILQLYIERSVLVLIETTYEILQLTLRDQC